jgi:hypothetical protein
MDVIEPKTNLSGLEELSKEGFFILWDNSGISNCIYGDSNFPISEKIVSYEMGIVFLNRFFNFINAGGNFVFSPKIFDKEVSCNPRCTVKGRLASLEKKTFDWKEIRVSKKNGKILKIKKKSCRLFWRKW